jgi:hypothetical protein
MDTSTVSAAIERSGAQPQMAGQAWHGIVGWIGVSLLLVLEYGLFRQYAEREVIWAYPGHYDQTVYLACSYETFEHVLDDGVLSGLAHGLGLHIPNGTLLHLQAGLLYLLLGASRLSALTINFAYFALLQLVLVWTVRWYSKSWSLAILSEGLLLASGTPFYPACGLMDFNLNFGAFCLFGIFICLVLRSEVFASWRWSMLAGVGGAVLVLFRFLTAVYLGGVFGILFAGLLVQLWLKCRAPARLSRTKQRLGGLLIAGVALAMFIMPAVCWNWAMIRNYYGGHVTGGENKVRQQEFGVVNWDDQLLYYPRSLLQDHAGPKLLNLSGMAILAAAIVGRLCLGQEGGQDRVRCPSFKPALCFVILSLLVPLALLTAYPSPSPLVASIMVPALIWLVVLAVLWLFRLHDCGPGKRSAAQWLTGLAVPILGIGFYVHAGSLSQHSRYHMVRSDVEQVTELYECLGRRCQTAGWTTPVVSVNAISEYFWPTIISPLVYERQHVLLKPRMLLGFGLGEVSEAEAIAAIGQSDFVILDQTPIDGNALYPFQHCMEQMRPQLQAMCEQQFVSVGRFRMYGQDVTLYSRPAVAVSGGTTDHWITTDGLTLSASRDDLRRFPRIELQGAIHIEWLGKTPTVRAHVESVGHIRQAIPAHMTVTGEAYHIVADLASEDTPDSPTVLIRLDFDTFFVAKDNCAVFGVNQDMRRLVMNVPDKVRLCR